MDEVIVNFGGGIEIKSVGEGLSELRGPAIVFDPHDGGGADLVREYFSSDSYFGPGVTPGKTAEFEATFNHGIPTQEGLKALADYEFKNPVKTEVTDAGVIASLLLDEREEYEKALAEFARKNPGKLGWSSATASHRAKRERKSDGRTWIKRWPIVEIAVTHKPCEPRTLATVPLKSLVEADADGKAVDGAALFQESLRQREMRCWELTDALNTGARKVVDGAAAENVTGVTVNVREAMTALALAFAPAWADAATVQADEWLQGDRSDSFYLKSVFDELTSEDSGARAASKFSDHLEVVLAAAREVNQRAKDIQELRVKAGRVISAANRTRLSSLLEMCQSVAGEITALLQESEPKGDSKSAPDDEVLGLVAEFEAMKLAQLRATTSRS